MSTKTHVSILVAASGLLSAIFAVTQDFTSDFAFGGSFLTGWHTLGHATSSFGADKRHSTFDSPQRLI